MSALRQGLAGPLNDEQKKQLGMVHFSAKHLLSLINDLLDLSRIAAHRIELRTAAHDPEALVRAAIDAQRAAAAAREVEVVAELLPGTPAVEIDRERVLLVLSNLIGNAIRYGPARGRVAIRATVDGDRLRFEVRDQGPGVPPAYRLAVFDKYVRVPGAPAGGAGLGLYIAREIVRAHGGSIDVESQPGRGAAFTVDLPLEPAGEAAAPGAGRTSRPRPPAPGCHGGRPLRSVARRRARTRAA